MLISCSASWSISLHSSMVFPSVTTSGQSTNGPIYPALIFVYLAVYVFNMSVSHVQWKKPLLVPRLFCRTIQAEVGLGPV
jgi:hypothetical protein